MFLYRCFFIAFRRRGWMYKKIMKNIRTLKNDVETIRNCFVEGGGLLIDSDESARGLTFLCVHVGESAGRTTATTAEESGLRNADTRGGRRVRPEERMRRAGNFDESIPFCIVARARQKTPGTADAVPGVSGYGE